MKCYTWTFPNNGLMMKSGCLHLLICTQQKGNAVRLEPGTSALNHAEVTTMKVFRGKYWSRPNKPLKDWATKLQAKIRMSGCRPEGTDLFAIIDELSIDGLLDMAMECLFLIRSIKLMASTNIATLTTIILKR